MDVIIVSCVFQPEPIISAKSSSSLVIELTRRKHNVKVITNFPNRPAGKIYPGYHRHLYNKENNGDGLDILRCYSTLSSKSTLFSRLMENITFGITSSTAVLISKKPNVIYANTWPIFSQELTCLVAKVRRIPIILSIQDIYPESLTVQGRLTKSSMIYRMLRWVDLMNARSANALVVISDRFAKIYTEERGIPAEKVHVIPNWADEEEIKILPKEQARKNYNIPENAFVLVYAGNVGAAAGVETIIQAIGELPESSNVRLVIAGEGSQLNHCREMAKEIGNEKILFHSPWLREETSSLLSTADVLVLPTKGNQSLVSVPSKLITYLIAAKPILALAKDDSDITDLIHRAGCGWVIEPDYPEIVAETIQNIQTLLQQEFVRMGSAGRKYALEHHSREKNVGDVMDILFELAGSK